MKSDHEWLLETNVEMAKAETRGDRQFFERLVADAFAFRRANGQVLSRDEFLASISTGPERQTSIDSITFLGLDRALVTCIVTMQTPDGVARFHNVRLFIRGAPTYPWRLMAWANEPVR